VLVVTVPITCRDKNVLKHLRTILARFEAKSSLSYNPSRLNLSKLEALEAAVDPATFVGVMLDGCPTVDSFGKGVRVTCLRDPAHLVKEGVLFQSAHNSAVFFFTKEQAEASDLTHAANLAAR
jgi:hypothetical protein